MKNIIKIKYITLFLLIIVVNKDLTALTYTEKKILDNMVDGYNVAYFIQKGVPVRKNLKIDAVKKLRKGISFMLTRPNIFNNYSYFKKPLDSLYTINDNLQNFRNNIEVGNICVNRFPKERNCYLIRAKAYTMLRKSKKAIKDLNKYIAFSKKKKKNMNIAYFWLSLNYADMKNWEKAHKLINIFLKDKSKSQICAYLGFKAGFYRDAGDYKKLNGILYYMSKNSKYCKNWLGIQRYMKKNYEMEKFNPFFDIDTK